MKAIDVGGGGLINSHSSLFYCDIGLPNFENQERSFPALNMT